jgi:outer membrane protein OmpA-like peptidoglycan-associated protein
MKASGRSRWFVRLGGAAAMAVLALGLAGCKNVSKTDYDAAVNENAELRTRLQALEAERNAKDVQIAEQLRQTGTTTTDPAYGANVPATTNGGYSSNSNDQDFKYDNGRMVAEIAGDVLFASGQSTIKTDARKKLDRIAKTLSSKYQGASIRIEGHTDTDPIRKSKWGSNQALSEARADAVKAYLASKGVSSNRISTTGLGSTQPKSTKELSRRVEVIVLGN